MTRGRAGAGRGRRAFGGLVAALPLAAATLLGAVLRFAWLGERGWWRDEAFTVELLRLPFAELLRTVPDTEGTPPLYYVLAWGWTRVLGDSEVGLRSLSALVGTLVVPVAYLAARRLVDRRTGIATAFLAAASPQLVWHAQDARSYALLVLLAALSFLFFAELLRAPGRGAAVGFALASALALATHYFAVFLLVPQAAWLLAARRTRRLALAPTALAALTGLALLPIALAQRGNVDWISDVPRSRRLVEVAQEFLVGPQPPWERGVTLLAGALTLALVALLARAPAAARRAVAPAAVVGAAALALALVLAFTGLDYVLARNVVVAWLPLAVLAAAGAAWSRPSQLGAGVAAALVAVGATVVVASAGEPKHGAEDWRGAARALGPPPAGGRAILLWSGAGIRPFRLYRPDAEPLGADPPAVAEVAVAAVGPVHREVDAYADTLFPGPPFREQERRAGEWFTVVVFRARSPAPLPRRLIRAGGPGAPHVERLLERRGPG